MANDTQLTDILKFKKILEYFVLHMSFICNKKGAELSEELKTLYKDNDSLGNFTYKEGKIEKPEEENWKESGKGYNEDTIQQQLNGFIKEENNFSILGICQKICISVDATSGFKGGSYLHWVDNKSVNDKLNITQYTNGTNINPVFEINRSYEKEDNVTFIGLEVGPSQNSPTFVFAPMYFSFDELGLFKNAPSNIQDYNLQAFFEYSQEMRRNEIKGALTYKGEKQLLATKNMILTGAPGTGKTWSAKNIAAWMIKGKPYDSSMQEDEEFKTQCRFVQFHPSYDYTDFVEGLRPDKDTKSSQIGFERVNGIFKEFCANAQKMWKKKYDNIRKRAKDQLKYTWYTEDYIKANNLEKDIYSKMLELMPYVFIIDEINRGEMSKILGELFYSIDPGYRGINGKVNTQYQNMITDKNDPFKDGFFVPENVYIIGTMNDIDRSVESMDFAMRRRFSFLEVKANEREDMWTEDWKNLAKACMETINAEIDKIPGLSSAYHIGPAYFKKLNDYVLKDAIGVYGYDFFKLWDNHLYGVLFEYLRGKNNADTTINGIYDKYISRLIKAVNKEFTNGKDSELFIKNFSDIIKSTEEELKKGLKYKNKDEEEQPVEDNNSKKKSDDTELKKQARLRGIDKAKLLIERAMKLGNENRKKL